MNKIKPLPEEWSGLLNSEQKEAIENIQGPLLIIAGAGSGKTRVLTYRYAHLIKTYGICFVFIWANSQVTFKVEEKNWASDSANR